MAAGYDVQAREALFFGIQASVSDSTTKECEHDLLSAGDKLCVRTGRDLAVVARVGTNVGADTKLYVLGGYTNARLRATYDDGVNKDSAGTNVDGFRVGAGFEHDFGGNLFGKVEYNYSNYEKGVSRHYALAGLGVKF
ncbi:outer membrane immunogenic protein [Novosphingobium sp. PhB165]|nr:outer membrane immunogenic protein [Novosphingobium sp. PhB165]